MTTWNQEKQATPSSELRPKGPKHQKYLPTTNYKIGIEGERGILVFFFFFFEILVLDLKSDMFWTDIGDGYIYRMLGGGQGWVFG